MTPLTHQFRAFVASKDPSEGYRFFSTQHCPVSQFVGPPRARNISAWLALHTQLDTALRTRPWTFGALALRLSSEERVDG